MECAVCLSLRGLFSLPCGHEFCGNCHGNFNKFGMTTCPLCRAPFKKYGTFEQRLATFKDWKYGHIVDAWSLAANGFVRATMKEYMEMPGLRNVVDLTFRDAVHSIDCGLGLNNWKEGDSVRVEHTRLSSRSCRFVRNALLQAWMNDQ